MSELANKLKADGNFFDAYLIIKNQLSKDIGNTQLFCEFIDLALEIAMYDMVFDRRKQYVADADSAMALYAESTEMDESVLSLLRETRSRISQTFAAICQAEQEEAEQIENDIRNRNTELLNQLYDIHGRIKAAKSQSQFDSILSEVSAVETQINKSMLSAEQEHSYETLTRSFSKTISEKMEELNRMDLLDYNKRAASCFNDVLQAFKGDSGKYKVESNLKALMTSKFFAFDSSKLFNETLVFYNHVYSVVFQEVNDTMKYKLTEWALNSPKIAK